jgi:hypothetical protein
MAISASAGRAFSACPFPARTQLGAFGRNAFEIYLDGKPLVSRNFAHEAGYGYEAVELKAGKAYAIRIDYHQYLGNARIRLLWSHPAGSERDAALYARARPMPWCWCWAFAAPRG